jgi:hypothetical protein
VCAAVLSAPPKGKYALARRVHDATAHQGHELYSGRNSDANRINIILTDDGKRSHPDPSRVSPPLTTQRRTRRHRSRRNPRKASGFGSSDPCASTSLGWWMPPTRRHVSPKKSKLWNVPLLRWTFALATTPLVLERGELLLVARSELLALRPLGAAEPLLGLRRLRRFRARMDAIRCFPRPIAICELCDAHSSSASSSRHRASGDDIG